MSALLQVEHLRVHLRQTRLLDGIDLTLDRGETLGIVGESGCGKSLLALALMGLLPPPLRATGSVRLDGQNLLALPENALCRIRGKRLAMVFQEPMLSLNPVQPIGRQVAEGMRLQLGLNRADAEARTRRLLDRVGLPPTRIAPGAMPHTLSGGQRQRVMIAIALASDPDILIADEVSTALDMITQAQVMRLLSELSAEARMGLLLISHDLGLVAQAAARTLVLYAGRAAESGPTRALFTAPRHPYTHGLLGATLHATNTPPGSHLAAIPGQVPDPTQRPAGCAFAPRCGRAAEDCHAAAPPLAGPGGHLAACFHPLAAA
jgi:oligopeptide/dipeptide ABC transporter ATP-binding protein